MVSSNFFAQKTPSETKQPLELYTILQKYENSEPTQNESHSMSTTDQNNLISAASENRVQDLQFINKRDINTKLQNGKTALHIATESNSCEFI